MHESSEKTVMGVWSMDTVYELVNDMVCFEFIRSIMVHMQNIEAKAYVTSFLKLLAPVFIHELVIALDKLNIVSKADQMSPEVLRFINQERQRALKNIITRSPRAVTAVNEMGLDFSHEMYDINVITRDGNLLDTNFESFTDPIMNTDLWNRMFATPKALLSVLGDALLQYNSPLDIHCLWSAIEDELPEFAQRVDRHLSCTRYSYPSCRLFQSAPELTIDDRILILYRFRLVSSAQIIPDLIPSLVLDFGGIKIIDTARFFRKYKALVIELLGAQFKEPPTDFTIGIRKDIETEVVDSSFFRLNRSVRNNLHYETTHILSNEEVALVDHYQSIYLNVIIRHFSSRLVVKIDKECQQVTAYFKACMDKGMTPDEIARHSYLRYLVYIFTGKLIK